MNRRNFLKVLGVSVPTAVALVECPEVKAMPYIPRNVAQCCIPGEGCPEPPTKARIRESFSRSVPEDAHLVRVDFDCPSLQWIATLSHPTFPIRERGEVCRRLSDDASIREQEEAEERDKAYWESRMHEYGIVDDQYGIVHRIAPYHHSLFTLRDTLDAAQAAQMPSLWRL